MFGYSTSCVPSRRDAPTYTMEFKHYGRGAEDGRRSGDQLKSDDSSGADPNLDTQPPEGL